MSWIRNVEIENGKGMECVFDCSRILNGDIGFDLINIIVLVIILEV